MMQDQIVQLVPTTMILDRPTKNQPTVMTREQHVVLTTWRALIPTLGTEALANNLMRRFNVDPNTAWILAARFNNQETQ